MLNFPILVGNTNQTVFFQKPAGWLTSKHPWYPSHPDIISWIKKDSKSSFQSEHMSSVYHLDPEITGLAFIVKNSSLKNYYRNLYGSEKLRFVFQFLVKDPPSSKKLSCDLPLLRREQNRIVKVSRASGKKCQTDFFEIENLGSFALWEAQTTYFRLQQIRIHAVEVGLNIVNDSFSGNSKLLCLSELKAKYKLKGYNNTVSPIYDNISLHLKSVEFINTMKNVQVQECSFPKKWWVLYKQIKKYG